MSEEVADFLLAARHRWDCHQSFRQLEHPAHGFPHALIIRTMGLTEAEFHTHADVALDRLNRALGVVADEHDVEVLFQNGVLTMEIEEPHAGKIVISPNTPVRQIWIS